jgi:predicted secreted protein
MRTGRGLALAAALAAAVAGCGGPRGLYWPVIPPDVPAPRLVDESANGSSVDLSRTQWLLVRLPVDENGPFRWSVERSPGATVYPSGDTPRFETDVTGTRNAIFTFRAQSRGTSTLRFSYRNPEAPQQPASRIVAFDVVAR